VEENSASFQAGRQLKRPWPLLQLAEKDELEPIIKQGSRNV